jgi:integration host factor subunit beta
MNQISKNDIITQVAKRTGEKKDLVIKMVNETFTILREAICSADPELRVQIRDFGSFEVKKTKARSNARNPRTNEILITFPRRRTRFIPGKFIKDFLQRPI